MKKFYLLFLFGLFLTACTPFVDTRREAGSLTPVGQSSPDRIAICYNGLFSEEAELQKLAQEACAQTNRKAVRDTTRFLNCTLFYPNTAFFNCQPLD